MARFDYHQTARITLVACSLALVGVLAAAGWQHQKTHALALAAGDRSGESYLLGSALKTVVERHYPKIRIRLIETGGTVENLAMLEDGRAQLATAQADVLAGGRARAVAVLYQDTFQLLVEKTSPAKSLVDLRGKRIALARSGGQYQSFLHIAEHFGLHAADFQFVGANDEDASDAFLNGRADALFRVRAIGDPTIEKLAQTDKFRFLPMEQAAAMKIRYPAYQAVAIPVGAYSGNPAVPADDAPTVAVERMLLARNDADPSAIRAVTETLIERRQEMMEQIPKNMTEVRLLLLQVHKPDPESPTGPPLHAGALSFYNKDKPSFLMAHPDYVGLILTVGLMIGSWLFELKRWMQKKQKNNADQYSNRVVELIDRAEKVDSAEPLDEIWKELLQLLTDAVHDLDGDKLSEESFHSFRSILQIGMDVIKERRAWVTSSKAPAEALH